MVGAAAAVWAALRFEPIFAKSVAAMLISSGLAGDAGMLQVARAESVREITDIEMVRGGIIDLVAYLQDFWKNDIR